ncbi:hypothetical protein ONZ45_g18746 [Pleurotus djamor]|nr:hypothetical protein ONZ45_g18746 [Pleurotus djamor]
MPMDGHFQLDEPVDFQWMSSGFHWKGKKRALRRAQEEQQPWLHPATSRNAPPPHDDGTPDQPSGMPYNNYFSAPRFYCVETICAPCGAVIAWKKFAKSESEPKILKFLEEVYSDPETRPSYVAIDKACALLKHIAAQGHWEEWMETTRFIVDAYHYVNHRTTDFLCRTWCNPAPLNGSAPNLVVVDHDKEGEPYLKRAFNTQACEQLNAWLGGFQSILNRMSVSNFDWTIHVMLFMHSQRTIAKIALREAKEKAAAEAKEKAAAEAAEGTRQAGQPSTEQIQAERSSVEDQDANPDIDVDDADD